MDENWRYPYDLAKHPSVRSFCPKFTWSGVYSQNFCTFAWSTARSFESWCHIWSYCRNEGLLTTGWRMAQFFRGNLALMDTPNSPHGLAISPSEYPIQKSPVALPNVGHRGLVQCFHPQMFFFFFSQCMVEKQRDTLSLKSTRYLAI